MKFGISFGDAPWTRSLELARLAEQSGLDQAWSWDSHIIWNECYTLLGRLSAEIEKLQFGTCVTQPQTRDATVLASAFATLNSMTGGGRVICGIGRGDSSVRLMKRRPANLDAVEQAIDIIRTLGSGETMELDGVPVEIPWASGKIPVYLGAYGPKALRLAGRKADGVIFQIADPFVIEWGMQFVREGAEEAGRNPDDIVIHSAMEMFISDDIEEARNQCRWYPAMVGNHIADVLRHHNPDNLPSELTDYVQGRQDYDYRQHAEQGTEHSQYVPDEIIDRFCILGSLEQCEAKMRKLAEIGVSEFNLYPHVEGIESVIETLGRELAPRLRETVAA